ncbi:tripartite tricarboxylate transporter substrate binding protein [Biomaibacter acetigenes]|jgi:tripartite-type tricarboxylate transporter receptor subunit TctC|uniref:Tripartite tricarboxylate transporter substrate binding protein n=1 Tax=Biomaibacter acetigenes TaxID=2316383 RepID=A0A3G2R2V1_9FIRM|nr:tripartite tricarboxylate transporter substrate binding protein [Biomaibacter acetigenes]AYO29641.1 tripartite tricarboxylate transporter substrate binding protein [Biomaibacter acetigenes]
MKKNALSILIILLIISIVLIAGCGQSTKQTGNNGQSTTSTTQEQKGSTKYPAKQINLIIQAAPGGLSDTTARTVGGELEKILGVPVVCSNKPGASGAVAMSYVQASAPDGYTIGYVPVELTMIKALGFADIEPNSFDLIGSSNISPATVTVRADAPWKTLQEFIDYAKKNPEKVKVGNSGTGSIWHIAAASLEKAAGVKFNHVPFDGATPAIAALMGGHIDAVTVSVMEVKSGVDSGKLKVLGVMSDQKSEYLPNVPTLKEAGYDVNVSAWGGFAAPKGLPQNVKDVLYPAFEKAINSDKLKEIAKQRGFSVFYKNSDEFTKFANEQFDFYMKQIPAMGLKK